MAKTAPIAPPKIKLLIKNSQKLFIVKKKPKVVIITNANDGKKTLSVRGIYFLKIKGSIALISGAEV